MYVLILVFVKQLTFRILKYRNKVFNLIFNKFLVPQNLKIARDNGNIEYKNIFRP